MKGREGDSLGGGETWFQGSAGARKGGGKGRPLGEEGLSAVRLGMFVSFFGGAVEKVSKMGGCIRKNQGTVKGGRRRFGAVLFTQEAGEARVVRSQSGLDILQILSPVVRVKNYGNGGGEVLSKHESKRGLRNKRPKNSTKFRCMGDSSPSSKGEGM